MRRFLPLILGVGVLLAGITVFKYSSILETASTPTDRFSGGNGGGYSIGQFLQTQTGLPSPSPRFSGAEIDGYGQARLLTNDPPPILFAPRFSGGREDGYCGQRLLSDQEVPVAPPPRFGGGPLDGYAVGCLLSAGAQGVLSSLRFCGGAADGYDWIVLKQTGDASAGPALRFWGGGLDGHAVCIFLQSGSLIEGLSPRYSGGGFDGHDIGAIRMKVSDLAIDSDHDGLPDWWEVIWYTNITRIAASDDSDGDGANAFSEYVAGTAPTLNASVFSIVSLAQNAFTVSVTFPCSENRVYTLQSAGDLISGPWSDIPGYVNVWGVPSGFMTFTAPISTNPCVLRIKVDFP